MIRVAVVAEPTGYSEKRTKGEQWITAHPNYKTKDHPEFKGRPPDYWSEYKKPLREGFQNRCGYLAMREDYGTVDHFISINTDDTKAYDWSNFRFATAWVNSAKKPAHDGRLIDPHEVLPDLFEISLPDMQLKLNASVAATLPGSLKTKAEDTLTLLPIRDDERAIDARQGWYQEFKDGLPFKFLERYAPLVAAAVAKHNQSNGLSIHNNQNLP